MLLISTAVSTLPNFISLEADRQRDLASTEGDICVEPPAPR